MRRKPVAALRPSQTENDSAAPKNAEMHEEINKPIFVVGSPRSGTSILAWCLGHHPNIFPVPESNWMGDFAVNVADELPNWCGARHLLHLKCDGHLARMNSFPTFGRSINSLVLKHRCDLDQQRLIIAIQRLLKSGTLPGRSDWRIRCCYQCSGSAVRNGR